MTRMGSDGRRRWLAVALALAVAALAGCPASDEPSYYIERLRKDNEEVRRRAVEELVRMHKKAMPEVREALSSENPNVRIGAGDFLGKVRRMESLSALGELIEDPNKQVRLKSIESVAGLSQVWKPKAVELLARAFDGSDPDCVKKAGEGLRDMRYEEATEVLEQRFGAGRGIQAVYAARLLYEIEPTSARSRFLLEALLSDNAAIRQGAEANVKELKDRIVPALVEFIETEQGTARAERVLNEVRQALIDELAVTLDTKRAAEILMALGTVADEPSIEKLNSDLRDTKWESAWRVAAARGLALAALSPRTTPAEREQIERNLTEVMDDRGQDKRIRIGAAIALCRLNQDQAVEYLLNELDRFQEAVKEQNISQERLDDLTELRIGAQEALVTAGEFVVPFLMGKVRGQEPGPFIIWAAAKTFGELRVQEAVPLLGDYLTERREPKIAVGEDGSLTGEGADADWQGLSAEQIEETARKLEVFRQPDFVRWTAAVALARIGGERTVSPLREAARQEAAFLRRLRAVRGSEEYYRREPVVEALIGSHEDVLFYVRQALEGLGEDV